MGIPFKEKCDEVFGLGKNLTKVCRVAQVAIDIGDGLVRDHDLEVLDIDKDIGILGRRFLSNFSHTVFDWRIHRIGMGDYWKDTIAAAQGGQALTRSELIQFENKQEVGVIVDNFEYDVNPLLAPEQI